MALISFDNVDWIEEQFQKFLSNPSSVEPTWRAYFQGWEMGKAETGASPELSVYHLIEAYRMYGHLAASINPIAVESPSKVPELQIKKYGFSDENEVVPTCGFLPQKEASVNDIVSALQKTYASSVGIEYIGLGMPELEEWLQKRIEPGFPLPFTSQDRLEILQDLNRAELLEAFLHTKFVGQKRFSLEGGETLIPMLAFMLEEAAESGATEGVIGMAHRGRLNVLANIMNKSYASIFHEFEDHYSPDLEEGTGDVKYHKGFAGQLTTKKGKNLQVTLAANPSHLESVDPVVEGQCRAKQEIQGRETIIPILIHGDASLAGQGVVYETMQLGKLTGYQTGGTIHIVINNQIGFTTLPKDSRSTRYCTDIAHAFGAPVFHVNAEKPEECVYAAVLALQIRQKFHCDVFLDLNCYRKYGHNEGDEPAFTQPLEYHLIRGKKSIRELYTEELLQNKVLEPALAEQMQTQFKSSLSDALEKVEPVVPPNGHAPKEEPTQNYDTKVPQERLIQLAEEFCRVPEGFTINPKIERLLKERLEMVHGKPVDWGMGEHLAFATLLDGGTHIRLSGQDSRRGTFSHRHAMWVDQSAEKKKYFALSHLKDQKAKFDIFNSSLSEFAVLGFEFGYSLSMPHALVIWEAQYGDFANGGQIIIDQYVAAAEQKWGLKSDLTLMLPHGYEGQGPEHSSARIERYLQLCGHDNFQVVQPTTPAQLFHVLRRQAHMQKPLVLFTPKALLRHPDCVSPLSAFSEGEFSSVLEDVPANPRRLLFCTGKIYYELAKKVPDIGVIRIEELYPFPKAKILELLKKYASAKELFWVQEEHANMGAFEFVQSELKEIPLHFVGRDRSASPAAGSFALHKKQQEQILREALG
ncbi:MAG: 2-oxoglutarate dehydrogenase E1 component [Verrucomicrobia bacterium]|nr:2-oxoglutarate dehydrogenase E1 component [Verrucomicrobiota bacterium]